MKCDSRPSGSNILSIRRQNGDCGSRGLFECQDFVTSYAVPVDRGRVSDAVYLLFLFPNTCEMKTVIVTYFHEQPVRFCRLAFLSD